MAGLFGVLSYPATASGTSTKTLLQLTAPTNQRLRLKEVSLSFQGIGPVDAPIEVQLLDQTSAGTMTSLSPVNEDDAAAETLQATGARDASAEPTAGNIRKRWYVHPQQGVLWQSTGDPAEMIMGGGKRVGLKIIAPGVSVSVVGYIRYEE